MVKNIIKYLGIALVIFGVFLVMRNLFAKELDTTKEETKDNKTYSITIKLLDKESKKYLSGSKLILEDKEGKVVAEWTTEAEAYVVKNLAKGKYKLIQESATDGYHLNEQTIEIEIKDKNKTTVMYNTAKTEEEIKQENTSKDDVSVENTSSTKSMLSIVIAIILGSLGLKIIYKENKARS